MHELDYYSPDYASARSRFRQRAQEQGAELYALPVNERRGLYIDIALWRGSSDTLILHSSGLHGVETFPGSAVQCALLDTLDDRLRQDHSLALIHCINPYGMHYLRRWNADNVDLNRNFLDQFDEPPANPMYEKIHAFVNPSHASQLYGFTLRALGLLTRYRFAALQQAIAQGQYQHPEGLFFGGTALSTEARLLLQFFQDHLSRFPRIRGIDYHTGLGRYGQSGFYLEAEFDAADHLRTEALLGTKVIYARAGKKQSYRTQGSFIARLRRLCHPQDFLMVTQEIGTVGAIRILRALREENYCYHHHLDQLPEAALHVKKVFCPEDDTWKIRAVQEGVRALQRLMHASPV